MRYRVFDQGSVPHLPIELVLTRGAGAFEIVQVEPDPDAPVPCLHAQVSRASDRDVVVKVTILSRYSGEVDRDEARRAATLGRAAGMDSLAERCPTIHEVIASEDADPRVVLELCAAIAAVGLGPILPPDGQTLLGVRSARQLARA